MENSEKNKLERNIPLLYMFMFFWLALVIIPVMVPFFASKGLSVAEVFYLQAIFAAIVLLFEVPSGYIADVLGRKIALQIGSVFHALGFTWLYFADNFIELVMFEALVAVGMSLLSGADLSMLYDTQDVLGHSIQQRTKGIANMRAVKSFAEGLAALLGGVLIAYSFDATVLANAIFAWVPIVLSFFLVEPPFHRMESAKPLTNMVEVFRKLYFDDKLLKLICINTTLFSLATFYVVWMIQPYWQDLGIPLTWFGVLWAAQSFVIAITSKLCTGLEEKFGARPVLLLMGLLPAVGYLGMSNLGGVAGLVLSFCFFVSRGLNQVIMSDALNSRTPASYRATANSLVSFTFRGVYIVTGPIVGFSIEWFGMSSTLGILGAAVLLMVTTCLVPLMAEIRVLETNRAEQKAGEVAPPVTSCS